MSESADIAVMKSRLGNIEKDVSEIKDDIKELKKTMPKIYVSKAKFEPFEKVFWLGMGLLIATVGGRILNLI